MKNRQIPKGVRDLLPEEAKNRRSIENKAVRMFRSYGYEEVITPTFEFMEVVETGAGENLRRELFLFMDREGGILSLRPEMTTSIARMAATHMQADVLPRRIFYSANVFRHVQPHLAQYREFWQIGIELLGAPGPLADAEVISLAVKALQSFGLSNFRVSLNQSGIFKSLLDASPMKPGDKEMVRNLIESKDLVELSRLLESLAISDELKETIARLPVLHGNLDVIKKIPYVEKNRQTAAEVKELIMVYDALKLFGVEDKIVVDMGVLRGLDYYTGVVFEGYSPELGYGLLGGGRYDNLLAQFGFDCPATGFALGMDRVALVLKNQDEEPPHILLGGPNLSAIIKKADELRNAGHVVEMDVESHSRAELQAKMEGRENCTLIYLEDQQV